MAFDGSEQRLGEVFDAVAEGYDRFRPSYPPELVDQACAIGALAPGARVLEVGCGTGKLTEALVERGLAVTAVDPGPNMIAFARKRVDRHGAAEFQLGRFEDVPLPESAFAAVFAATAFHWVDPTVGWAKVARLLRPGGILALLAYVQFRGESTAENDEALHAVFEKYVRHHGTWYPLRDAGTIRAGVEDHATDVSAVWTWLGHHDLLSPDAAILFDDIRLATHAISYEQTVAELWARFETTSSYQLLAPAERLSLERELHELFVTRGETLSSSELAVLVTASRA